MKMTMATTGHILTSTLVFIASLSISSGASLEGVAGSQQEMLSDAGSVYWGHAPVHVRRSVQYCGARLVEAIRNLCKGNTYAPLSRRSDPTSKIFKDYKANTMGL